MHLDAHNKYRQMHKVPPMIFDENLARGAQAYAEKLHRAGEFLGYSNTEFGENIIWNTNKEECYETSWASDQWYKKEIDRVDWNDLKLAKGTYHLTQMIWKSSTKLGMGIKGKFVVARYKEVGNVEGCFDANVFPKN